MLCTVVFDNIMQTHNSHQTIRTGFCLCKFEKAPPLVTICAAYPVMTKQLQLNIYLFLYRLPTNLSDAKVCLSGLIWLVETLHPCVSVSLVLYLIAAAPSFLPLPQALPSCANTSREGSLINPNRAW